MDFIHTLVSKLNTVAEIAQVVDKFK